MRKTKWDSIKHFFSRSIRRDTAAEWEYRSIVKIKPNGGCTGFWVENSRNRALMITARHCFNWDITSACNGSFKVYTAYGEYEYAHCKQVIAAANNLDIALVEMEITSNAYHRATLGLAKFTPKVNTSLMMIGFPADSLRRSHPTVTSGCNTRSSKPERQSSNPNNRDWAILHNCTTWGGNSGGPMLAEGTFTVVGLPSTYNPKSTPNDPVDSSTMNADDLAKMDLMSGFVAEFKPTLEKWGVHITSF